MGITEQIEEAKRSDSLLLLVFYADWSPHYEWMNRWYMNLKSGLTLWESNIEVSRVADTYEISSPQHDVLQRKDKVLWEKTRQTDKIEVSWNV